MNESIRTSTALLIVRMLTGDPVESIESAKKLVASPSRAASVLLTDIVSNRRYRLWSRIAAIYALGLMNDRTGRVHLIEVLSDPTERPQIRSHAAEALGNLGDKRSVSALAKVAADRREHSAVRQWSIYALSQIGGTQALLTLKSLKSARPSGRVGKELASALKFLKA